VALIIILDFIKKKKKKSLFLGGGLIHVPKKRSCSTFTSHKGLSVRRSEVKAYVVKFTL